MKCKVNPIQTTRITEKQKWNSVQKTLPEGHIYRYQFFVVTLDDWWQSGVFDWAVVRCAWDIHYGRWWSASPGVREQWTLSAKLWCTCCSVRQKETRMRAFLTPSITVCDQKWPKPVSIDQGRKRRLRRGLVQSLLIVEEVLILLS